jgi:acetylornithine aminotransferase
MDNYGTPKLSLVRGAGSTVWDADGKEYVDYVGGIAVNALGHGHPAVVEAVSTQIASLGHVSNLFVAEPPVALAERLLELFGRDGKVFFCNSGAEANEAAFKIGRLTGRTHMVATEGGFHGRTMGALALTGQPGKQTGFHPLPGDVTHVPYGDAQALAAAVTEETALVIIEPVQGEKGVVVPPAGYLKAARAITAATGSLLVLDEVQTGVGRTGHWFEYQAHEGVLPDVVTLAKGLGGGLPIGAAVAFGRAAELLRPGQHGTTFGGNPVACAAALATLDVVEPLLGGHVDKVSTRLADGLAELRGRLTGRSTWAPPSDDGPDEGLAGSEVRGAGLWFALDLGPEAPADARQAALAALGRGLVVNPVTDTALRLAPPLVVTEDEVDEGLGRLGAALEEAGLCR